MELLEIPISEYQLNNQTHLRKFVPFIFKSYCVTLYDMASLFHL